MKFLNIFVVVLLFACGGGGDDPTPVPILVPTPIPPVIVPVPCDTDCIFQTEVLAKVNLKRKIPLIWSSQLQRAAQLQTISAQTKTPTDDQQLILSTGYPLNIFVAYKTENMAHNLAYTFDNSFFGTNLNNDVVDPKFTHIAMAYTVGFFYWTTWTIYLAN